MLYFHFLVKILARSKHHNSIIIATLAENSFKPIMNRFFFIALFLTVMAHAIAQDKMPQADIPGPGTEFVMQLQVTLGEAYSVGATPHGQRTVIPITGGTFEGPLLRGTILNGGADWQLSKEGRTEVEAIYSIKTDDGVYIHIRNRGLISMGKNEQGQPSFYFRTAPQFEAPEDSKYAWLNNSLFLCGPAPSPKGGITLNVWRVK